MSEKASLIISCGPWQSFMGVAALEVLGIEKAHCEVIVLLKASQRHLYEQCVEIHRSLGIHTSKWLVLGRSGRRTERLNALNNRHYACVLSPGLGSRTLIELVTLAKSERIVLFEDGLHATDPVFLYGPLSELKQQRYFKKWLSGIRSLRSLGERQTLHQLRAKIAGVCGFMELPLHCGDLELPAFKIGANRLRENAHIVAETLDLSVNPEPDYTLILGSFFAAHKTCSYTEEYRIIEAAVSALQDEGRVYWKPHPRTEQIFTEYLVLKKNVTPLEKTRIALPLEILVGKAPPKRVASIMSSSLVYCQDLFGSECFRICSQQTEEIFSNGKWRAPYAYLREKTRHLAV